MRSSRSSGTAPTKRCGFVGDIEFVEVLRQFDGLAHVVDRLADVPGRRHGDEFRLHAPAGRVLRIIEAAASATRSGGGNCSRISACSSLGRSSRIVTASSDSMSRTPSATVRGVSSSRISSRTMSSTSVSAVKSKSMPSKFDKARALIGLERLDHGAEIGLVQAADQPRAASRCRPASIALATWPQISLADGAVVVARQGPDFSFGHARSRRCDQVAPFAPLVASGPRAGQMINA